MAGRQVASDKLRRKGAGAPCRPPRRRTNTRVWGLGYGVLESEPKTKRSKTLIPKPPNNAAVAGFRHRCAVMRMRNESYRIGQATPSTSLNEPTLIVPPETTRLASGS